MSTKNYKNFYAITFMNLNCISTDYVFIQKQSTSVNWYITRNKYRHRSHRQKFENSASSNQTASLDFYPRAGSSGPHPAPSCVTGPFAADMGWRGGEPFVRGRWRPSSPSGIGWIALFFHLYGLICNDADYILAHFPSSASGDAQPPSAAILTRDPDLRLR